MKTKLKQIFPLKELNVGDYILYSNSVYQVVLIHILDNNYYTLIDFNTGNQYGNIYCNLDKLREDLYYDIKFSRIICKENITINY